MDSTQTPPTTKKPKGIKKLWAKVKASMKSESQSSLSKNSVANTTPTTSQPAATPTSTTVPVGTPREPVAEPELNKAMESEHFLEQLTIDPDLIEVDESEEPEEIYNTRPESVPLASLEGVQIPVRISARGSASDRARFERAQAVFKKHNLALDVADWHASSKLIVERVERKPRMRVRHNCHECKSTFGRDRMCPECQHQRCSTCIRHPPKRAGRKAREKKIETMPTIVADIPTVGACHECKSEFTIGATACGNCDHSICARCLTDTVNSNPVTAPPPAPLFGIAAAS